MPWTLAPGLPIINAWKGRENHSGWATAAGFRPFFVARQMSSPPPQGRRPRYRQHAPTLFNRRRTDPRSLDSRRRTGHTAATTCSEGRSWTVALLQTTADIAGKDSLCSTVVITTHDQNKTRPQPDDGLPRDGATPQDGFAGAALTERRAAASVRPGETAGPRKSRTRGTLRPP